METRGNVRLSSQIMFSVEGEKGLRIENDVHCARFYHPYGRWNMRGLHPAVPSLHHRHGKDKTVFSCLVRVGGVNRIGDKSRLSATENFETVLSSIEIRCEQSFILSRPSLKFTTRSCLQTRSHHMTGQNRSVSNIIIEDYWKQSWLVANFFHTTDKTRQYCIVHVGGVNVN